MSSTPIFEIIPVPSSAGNPRDGIERAPEVLLAAGFTTALEQAGASLVMSDADIPPFRQRPDIQAGSTIDFGPIRRYAQYSQDAVASAISNGRTPVVLGGDCTIEIGVVAAHIAMGRNIGIIYIDAHCDLNVPGSAPKMTDGFVEGPDWQVNGHMLGIHGADDGLARQGPRYPLILPEMLAVVGSDPAQTTEFEKAQVERLGLTVVPWMDAARDPEGVIHTLLNGQFASADTIIIHFDTDALNYPQTPIAEIALSIETGFSLSQAARLIHTVAQDKRFGGLTITEISAREEDSAEAKFQYAIGRFVQAIAPSIAVR